MLGEAASGGAAAEQVRANVGKKQASPRVHPKHLSDKVDSLESLKGDEKALLAARDKLYIQWHTMRKNCRLLREQTRDLEQDVLAEGHMTLLALEMKLAVEKRAVDVADGETPPQDQYKKEVSRNQVAQSASYKVMLKNRRLTEKVCATELELEGKYKRTAGDYHRASTQLKWRLAHGCFHHGLAHYCVRVKRWCGKGQATHPCEAEAEMTNESAETTSTQNATGGYSKTRSHKV